MIYFIKKVNVLIIAYIAKKIKSIVFICIYDYAFAGIGKVVYEMVSRICGYRQSSL